MERHRSPCHSHPANRTVVNLNTASCWQAHQCSSRRQEVKRDLGEISLVQNPLFFFPSTVANEFVPYVFVQFYTYRSVHMAVSFSAHSILCVFYIFFVFLHMLLLKVCLHSHVMPLIQPREV